MVFLSTHPQEWHLKCSHYFILTASRGSLMTQALLRDDPGQLLHSNVFITLSSFTAMLINSHHLFYIQF